MLPINGLKKGSRAKPTCFESMRWPWATTALKRLASAVQLRPAAPYFQALSKTPLPILLPIASNSIHPLPDLAFLTQLFHDSLLRLGNELLVNIQRPTRHRVPHLRLRVFHVGSC